MENKLIDIGDTEITDALAHYITEHGCMMKSPLTKMTIGAKDVRTAYQYTLSSFTEYRETKRKYRIYYGGCIDDQCNGPIPFMWDIVVGRPTEFGEKYKTKLIMPHSEEVRTCHGCNGCGTTTCTSCSGSGGSYQSTYNTNTNSHESRWETCTWCSGCGYRTCSTCLGNKELLWYLQLKVVWNTFTNDCFINEFPTDIFPNKLIEKSSAEVVFAEESGFGPCVEPVLDFPYIPVCEASKGFTTDHRSKHLTTAEKILKQRHQIRALPIAMIDWEYKRKSGKFFVYGN